MGLDLAFASGRNMAGTGTPLRPDPDWRLAQIDKDEQVAHILDCPLPLGRTRAFVVSGNYGEWPEAVKYKLACCLESKKHEYSLVDLNLPLRRNFDVGKAQDILFEVLRQHLPLERIELKAHSSDTQEAVDRKQIAGFLDWNDAEQPPKSYIFCLKLNPVGRNPKPRFLAKLIEAWEAILPQKGGDRPYHYLLLVLTSDTSAGKLHHRLRSCLRFSVSLMIPPAMSMMRNSSASRHQDIDAAHCDTSPFTRPTHAMNDPMPVAGSRCTEVIAGA